MELLLSGDEVSGQYAEFTFTFQYGATAIVIFKLASFLCSSIYIPIWSYCYQIKNRSV
ncbi:MAG: hypothetical protein ACRDBA_18095 [Clostridium sp.]